MDIIAICTALIILVPLIIVGIYHLIIHNNSAQWKILVKDYAGLTFKQFISFYNVNPSKWSSHRLQRYIDIGDWSHNIDIIRLQYNNESSYIMSSYKEWKKFNRWYTNKEKIKTNKAQHQMDISHAEQLVKLCQDVRQDAAQIEEQARKELYESVVKVKEANIV